MLRVGVGSNPSSSAWNKVSESSWDSLLWDLTGLCPTPSPAGVSQPSKWSPKIHQATRREENGLPVLSSPAGKSQCRLAPTRTQRQIWGIILTLPFPWFLIFSPGWSKMVFFLFASTIWQCPIQKARKEVWAPPQSAGEGASVQGQGCSQPHGDYSPSQEYCGTRQLPRSRPYCHSPETKALQSQCQLSPPALIS